MKIHLLRSIPAYVLMYLQRPGSSDHCKKWGTDLSPEGTFWTGTPWGTFHIKTRSNYLCLSYAFVSMLVSFCVQLDFWREPVHESLPVDVYVPFHSLQAVRVFLRYNQIQYNVMIMDVQVGLLIQLFDCYDYNSLETKKSLYDTHSLDTPGTFFVSWTPFDLKYFLEVPRGILS